jgi:hypothetical protein
MSIYQTKRDHAAYDKTRWRPTKDKGQRNSFDPSPEAVAISCRDILLSYGFKNAEEVRQTIQEVSNDYS